MKIQTPVHPYTRTIFRHILVMCCTFIFVVSCSQRTDKPIKPTISKKMFVSKTQQNKIAASSKAIFEAFEKNMLARRNQKTTYIDSVAENPNILLEELLQELRMQDSVSYDAFANSPEGANYLQNYLNPNIPQGFDNILNSFETYVSNIDNTFKNISIGTDTISTALAAQTLETTTLNYETSVLNDANLSANDKTILLTVTTYMLSSKDYLANVAGNLSMLNEQKSQKGRFGNWLRKATRTVTRVIASLGIGIAQGALIGTLIGTFPTGTVGGAIGGFVASLYLVTRNQCMTIFNGRRLIWNCW